MRLLQLHVLLSLYVSFTLASFFIRNAPIRRELKIEQFKYRINNYQLFDSPRGLGLFKTPAGKVLRRLYEMVEDESDNFSNKHMNRVSLIFDNNAIFTYSPAKWAILNDKLAVLEHFIEYSLFIHVSDYIASCHIRELLQCSIEMGKFEAFKMMYSKSLATITKDNFLTIAARHHISDEFFNYLLDEYKLEKELDHSSSFYPFHSPLQAAVKFNNHRAALILLERGADPSFALQMIMDLNRQRLLTELLETISFFCDYKDSSGKGILHYAARHASDPKIIDVILNSSCEFTVNDFDSDFASPLRDALTSHNAKKDQIAEVLIKRGADVFFDSWDGKNPLQIIVRKRKVDLFNLILVNSQHGPEQMKIIMQIIEEEQAWLLFDQILLLNSKFLDLLTADISKPSITFLIAEKAKVTFELLLRNRTLLVTDQELKLIAESETQEFYEIFMKYRDEGDQSEVRKFCC